jgi:hypothetical protein
MKKLVLTLAFLGAFALIQAQTGEDWYVAENDTHASDVTATEIVTTEPITVTTIVGNTEPVVAEASNNTPDMDMTASVEGSYSEYSKKITIPLWYRWRDYSFNAFVPYFISKEQDLGSDRMSVSGIGDVSLGISYGKYFEQYKTYTDVNFSVKMPTGDPEADDDGAIIPLGSDTWDFSLALSGFYFMDAFTFKSSVLYKMNGIYESKGDIYYKYDDNGVLIDTIEDPETDIGDLFIFSVGADYRWQYRLTFGLGILYGNHMSSEIEGDDNKNGLQFIDLMPTVKYPISLFEFVVGANIPVMTSSEAYDPDNSFSNQENRNPTFYFKTNYRIF